SWDPVRKSSKSIPAAKSLNPGNSVLNVAQRKGGVFKRQELPRWRLARAQAFLAYGRERGRREHRADLINEARGQPYRAETGALPDRTPRSNPRRTRRRQCRVPPTHAGANGRGRRLGVPAHVPGVSPVPNLDPYLHCLIAGGNAARAGSGGGAPKRCRQFTPNFARALVPPPPLLRSPAGIPPAIPAWWLQSTSPGWVACWTPAPGPNRVETARARHPHPPSCGGREGPRWPRRPRGTCARPGSRNGSRALSRVAAGRP